MSKTGLNQEQHQWATQMLAQAKLHYRAMKSLAKRGVPIPEHACPRYRRLVEETARSLPVEEESQPREENKQRSFTFLALP